MILCQDPPYPGPEGWSCTWCGAYNNWQSTACWKCGNGKS